MGSVAVEYEEKVTSQQVLFVPEPDSSRLPCCSQLKMFIAALSFAFFSKALSGTYMKSAVTQIERRFDLSSSLAGLVDVGFEIGNLLFLAVVSHFGAKLHRPRLIAAGCVIMAVGCALTGLPHFFMGQYKYDTLVTTLVNESVSIAPCLPPADRSGHMDDPSLNLDTDAAQDCVQYPGSSTWVYLFLGNALRGIGETPITPLGISYIDDFAKPENSAFYIACLQTIMLLGPMFGFLLGSMCAKIYVDFGFVDIDSVTISPTDTRWVGAWWLGFFVSSALMLLACIPFWFLPRSLLKQGEEPQSAIEHLDPSVPPQSPVHHPSSHATKLADIAKGFLPSLKKLLCTPVYFLLLCGSVLKFNSFVGLLTFKAKYMEQQFGQSASRANFLIGVANLPAVAVGIFLGGLLMKRYKLSVVSGAQLSLATSFAAYLLVASQIGIKCENLKVAGLTISYNGTPSVSSDDSMLLAPCNKGCSCSTANWDPVCSEGGVTYASPCLAGCTGSSGLGKHTMFHNCSCASLLPAASASHSVSLGQCPHSDACGPSFATYMGVSVLSSFINSLGATPGYMVIIRCIKPDLKSLALGIQTLVTRSLGGIPAPVYFGALIDTTCLRWGVKKCGRRGACRMYNSDMYRVTFLGLITCLSGSAYFFKLAMIVLLKRQFRKEEEERSGAGGGAADATRANVELQCTHTPVEEASIGDRCHPNGEPQMKAADAEDQAKERSETTDHTYGQLQKEGDRTSDQMNGQLQTEGDGATDHICGQHQKGMGRTSDQVTTRF